MNFTELVDAIAKESNVAKSTVRTVLKNFQTTVMRSLSEENEVQLTGFGKFTYSRKPESEGVSPGGVKYTIPERLMPRFKPGSSLKSYLMKR
jgi:DNA-binding protein HU-beta